MRRILLVLVVLVLAAGSAQAASVSVLYKRDSETSLARLDPAAQATLQAMEEKLIENGLEVIQPQAALYELLDKSRGVVLNFSADAGLTLTLDVSSGQRPNPGADSTWAEIRLRAKIYSGRKVLASLASFGAVAFRVGAQERAFEVAARRAVDDLAEKLLRKLDAAPVPVVAPAPSLEVSASEAASDEVRVPKGVKWGLMIGVSDFTHAQGGESGQHNLPGVAVDMLTIRKALTDLGVEPGRMMWLFNEKATTQNVREALQRLQSEAHADDLVYVYFSTHGLPKTEGLSRFGIPVTYDYRKDNFVDFEQIRASLGALAAQNVIWINDTCHSGLAAEGLAVVEIGARDFGMAPPGAFDVSKAAAIVKKNIAVISSASGSQSAADLGPQGGLFSTVFARGAEKLASSRKQLGVYSFYKQYVDGQVQAWFHKVCNEVPAPGFCSQGTQQPVFGAQHDGKLIGM